MNAPTQAISDTDAVWLVLTPVGALKAFAQRQPDEPARALQALLNDSVTLTQATWLAKTPGAAELFESALGNAWIECLPRCIKGPEVRLDDFVQHVIVSLSGEHRAVLASETGFCLGRAGVSQDEADALSAAAADYSDFSQRQIRRGWAGVPRYVAFHADAEMLLPTVSFIPLWVEGVGYWLIVYGEPLLNNPALVELLWGIREAGNRFLLPTA